MTAPSPPRLLGRTGELEILESGLFDMRSGQSHGSQARAPQHLAARLADQGNGQGIRQVRSDAH